MSTTRKNFNLSLSAPAFPLRIGEYQAKARIGTAVIHEEEAAIIAEIQPFIEQNNVQVVISTNEVIIPEVPIERDTIFESQLGMAPQKCLPTSILLSISSQLM
ncbi:hypothetical protein EPUL_005302 [Erysiphe pulchra]|uniref:Uncharacterized protein n=1 Tax=Erysiphe pulchra TaxID=225359 RepID=A0A2S4PN38_9PEZI|nr:hypothetical protein EPUL_005302 [Erysiphe pulchra]